MSERPVHEITSAENPTFRAWKRLLAPGGVKKENRVLVSGGKIVEEVSSRFPERVLAWVVSGRDMPPAPARLVETERFQVAPELFQILDVFGTRSPLVVFRPPDIPRWDPEDGLPPGLSLLIPFQDPENVGGVVRSAVAFGVARIILLAGSAHPYHPKALRASAGSMLHAPLAWGPRLDDLPMDLPLIPLSGEGKDLATATFPSPSGLLPGPEGPGLPEPWRPRAVAIRHLPGVESLNAAAAVAIALYAWSESRVSRSKGTSVGSREARGRRRR